MADLNPAFVQQILHVAKRERRSHVYHHRQADDFGQRLEVPEWAALGHPERLGGRLASLKNFVLTMPQRRV